MVGSRHPQLAALRLQPTPSRQLAPERDDDVMDRDRLLAQRHVAGRLAVVRRRHDVVEHPNRFGYPSVRLYFRGHACK